MPGSATTEESLVQPLAMYLTPRGQDLVRALRRFDDIAREDRTAEQEIALYVGLRQLNYERIASILTEIYPRVPNAVLRTRLTHSYRWPANLSQYVFSVFDDTPPTYGEYSPCLPEVVYHLTGYYQELIKKISPQGRYELAAFWYVFVASHFSLLAPELVFIRGIMNDTLNVTIPDEHRVTLDPEEYPEEPLPAPRPASSYERYIREQLCAYLKVDAIPLHTVRTIIDNAQLVCTATRRGLFPCILCGAPDQRGTRSTCATCREAFVPQEPALRPEHEDALARATTTMREYHSRMANGELLDYGKRCPSLYAQPSYIGIELELESPSTSQIRELVRQVASRAIPGICKSDGSLRNGAEYVTVPMTPSKAQTVLEEYCTLAKELGFVAKHSCGMHIHLNRTGFNSRSHVARFHNLFSSRDEVGEYYLPTKFLKAYVGERRFRQNISDSGRYCKRGSLDVYAINEHGNLIGNDRYRMVSLTNKETVEVRWFAATTNVSKVKSNIQFVVAAREYTRDNVSISWKGFCRYVKRNEAQYPDLLERLIRFRSVTAQEIAEKEQESVEIVETVL